MRRLYAFIAENIVTYRTLRLEPSLPSAPTETNTKITQIIFSCTFAAFAANISCRADFTHAATTGTCGRFTVLHFVSLVEILPLHPHFLPYGPCFKPNIHCYFAFANVCHLAFYDVQLNVLKYNCIVSQF